MTNDTVNPLHPGTGNNTDGRNSATLGSVQAASDSPDTPGVGRGTDHAETAYADTTESQPRGYLGLWARTPRELARARTTGRAPCRCGVIPLDRAPRSSPVACG